jgi:CheY-like chemotaxis protein
MLLSENIVGQKGSLRPMQVNPAGTTARAQVSPQFVCRILIVDNNRERGDVSVTLAQNMGHHVRRAYQGVTAVEIAKQFVPDIVLLDFSKADAGLAVAAALRRLRAAQNAYIVALNEAAAADERKVYEDSVDAMLSLPLTADTVERLLWHWCERVHRWRASDEPAC